MPECSMTSNLLNQQANQAHQYNFHQHFNPDLHQNDSNTLNSLNIQQNQSENKAYFARVNSSRQSVVKNENGLWSNPMLNQNNNSIYTITLVNGIQSPGPLGIHVIPNFDSISQMDMGLIIQRIEQGSRVHRDGRLHAGDHIIEINKKNIVGFDFLKCQEILREAIILSNQNGILEFKIIRPNNPNIGVNFDQNETKEQIQDQNEPFDSLNNKETLSFKPTSINLGALNTKKIGTKIIVELIKGPESLGFKLAARDNCSPGEFSPIYIKNILPVGAAVVDGRLQRGDRLLEVNKIDMTQKTLNEAVEILRKTNLGDRVEIVVSRQVLEEPDTISAHSDTSKEVQNKSDDVIKNLNPKRQKLVLKISLEDSETKSLDIQVRCKNKRLEESENLVDLGIFVKAIKPGGAAHKDGRLNVNDQLININGVSLLGKSNDEAMSLLKEAMRLGNESEFIEIIVSRKNKDELKQTKREQSESPKKQNIKMSHTNRRSDEYGENEQYSKFDRDAPSRRSVSEKRTKICTVPSSYATYRRQRNQSLNDQNPKRSQTYINFNINNPVPVNSAITQTLGRIAKKGFNTNIPSQNIEYAKQSSQKSTSMESIPFDQFNSTKYNNKNVLDNQNKFETISAIRYDRKNRQSVHVENYVDYNADLDNSTLNRLKFTNRSFVAAVNKSIDKYTSNESAIEEKSELSEKSIMTKSEISNPEIIKKSTDSSSKHKSLIGKFQNLFKPSHHSKKADKNKNLTKINLPSKYTLKEDSKLLDSKIKAKNGFKKENEIIPVKNNNHHEVLVENDTLYTQYKPDVHINFNESKNASQLNQSSRDSYYHSIDSQQYLIEQQRILREKQKKILEKLQKYNTNNDVDRQSTLINRNSSILYNYRPESYEKIHFSEPFTASTQRNLVSDLIRESDYVHKYYSETASTTSSIISSSSVYTTSSIASEQQTQPQIHHQVEFSTQV